MTERHAKLSIVNTVLEYIVYNPVYRARQGIYGIARKQLFGLRVYIIISCIKHVNMITIQRVPYFYALLYFKLRT